MMGSNSKIKLRWVIILDNNMVHIIWRHVSVGNEEKLTISKASSINSKLELNLFFLWINNRACRAAFISFDAELYALFDGAIFKIDILQFVDIWPFF